MAYRCDICDTQADELRECCGQDMIKLDDDAMEEYAEIMGVNEDEDYE